MPVGEMGYRLRSARVHPLGYLLRDLQLEVPPGYRANSLGS